MKLIKNTLNAHLKKAFLLIFMLGSFALVNGQTPSNSNSQYVKNKSSNAQTKKEKQGKLVPHIALLGNQDKTTLKRSTTNLMIYNTAKAGEGSNKVYPGYYHNIGTTEKPNWERIDVTIKQAVKKEE